MILLLQTILTISYNYQEIPCLCIYLEIKLNRNFEFSKIPKCSITEKQSGRIASRRKECLCKLLQREPGGTCAAGLELEQGASGEETDDVMKAG